MKKKLIALLIVVALFGAGTVAFAQSNDDGDGFFSFEKMLPFMQQMHPDWSESELRSMFEACHGSNGEGSGMQRQNMMY